MAQTSDFIVVGYLAYLVVLAWVLPIRMRARWIVTVVSVLDTLGIWWVTTRSGSLWGVVHDWHPALQILIGYWLSGLFYVRPMPAVERWLMAGDRWLFFRGGLKTAVDRSPRIVLELLELAYLSVYVVVPAGFAVAWRLGVDVERYWTFVLLAELACYGALPWIQARPPRAVPDYELVARRPVAVRRLNNLILRHGSIQASTVPSGHAAGAVAVALGVSVVSLPAAIAFGVIALGIVIGSVVGRYHYAADSVAGVLVALVAWMATR